MTEEPKLPRSTANLIESIRRMAQRRVEWLENISDGGKNPLSAEQMSEAIQIGRGLLALDRDANPPPPPPAPGAEPPKDPIAEMSEDDIQKRLRRG